MIDSANPKAIPKAMLQGSSCKHKCSTLKLRAPYMLAQWVYVQWEMLAWMVWCVRDMPLSNSYSDRSTHNPPLSMQ